jgi:Leucine-rich repeat (LRR) protein
MKKKKSQCCGIRVCQCVCVLTASFREIATFWQTYIHSAFSSSIAHMGVAQTKDKDKGQSVTLDLKEKPLDKWLAEAKGHLKQIERLDLSRQELAELPPQIAKLVNLRFLQIYDNHLKSIPKEIGTIQDGNSSILIVGSRFLSLQRLIPWLVSIQPWISILHCLFAQSIQLLWRSDLEYDK